MWRTVFSHDVSKLFVVLHHRSMVLFWYSVDEVGDLTANLLLYFCYAGFTHEQYYKECSLKITKGIKV